MSEKKSGSATKPAKKKKQKHKLRMPHRVWSDPATGEMHDEPAVDRDMICHILGWSLSTFHKHRRQLLNEGAIFLARTRRPGTPRHRLQPLAFPSVLERWLHLNGLRLEKQEEIQLEKRRNRRKLRAIKEAKQHANDQANPKKQ